MSETERGVIEERKRREEWRREEWRRRKMRAELLIRSVIALRNAGKYRYIDIDIYAIEERACNVCIYIYIHIYIYTHTYVYIIVLYHITSIMSDAAR